MTTEEKRARHRAYQKAYYARHREKVLAKAKELRDSGQKKRYPRDMQSECVKRDKARYREKYKAERYAYNNARLRAKTAGKKDPSAVANEARRMVLYQAALAQVPAHTNRELRADIAAEIVVYCMENFVSVAQLPTHAPAAIRAYWKAHRMDTHGLSLDAPRFEDGGSMHDVVSEDQGLWADAKEFC